jgi:hypothetical protein
MFTELDHLNNLCESLKRYHKPILVSMEMSQAQYDELTNELKMIFPSGIDIKKCQAQFSYRDITFSIYNKDCLIE